MKKRSAARSVVKESKKVAKPDTRRRFPVWVVIRHTNSGDERRAVIDKHGRWDERDGPDKVKRRDADTRRHALDMAQQIAEEAARDYGRGSASVFSGELIINADCEMP